MEPPITMVTLFQPAFRATWLATPQVKRQGNSRRDKTDGFIDLSSKL
ncbi:uncharacterized protein METZ01_LOCUS418964, partial [marine metagenome]